MSVAVLEMFLMASLSFAIAFIWSEQVGLARGEIPTHVIDSSRMDWSLGNNPSPTVGGPASAPEFAGDPAFLARGGEGLGGLASDSMAGSTVTKSVFYNGQLYDGVTVMRSADGLDVANLNGAGYVSWDPSKNAWVSAQEGTVPAGLGDPTGKVAAGQAGAANTPAPGILDTLYGGAGFGGGAAGALVSGVIWAATVGFGLYFLGKMFGMTPNNAKALGYAGATAAGLWSSLHLLGANGVLAQNSFLVQWAPVIGIGAGVAVFLMMYKKEKTQIISFECYPWEPPLGGTKCEDCNKDPMRPCSEYRCKSLGQACGLVNQGSENEMCVNLYKGDVGAPTIIPTQDSLRPLESRLKYTPDKTISPPNTGVRISPDGNTKKCLKPFTRLEFGFNTSEPAQCKSSFEMLSTYDEMPFLVGETNEYSYSHLQVMSVPEPGDEPGQQSDAPIIAKDGTFTLWVRCRDAMGNANAHLFGFRYCVDPAPDVSPPIIEGFSIGDGSYVQFNVERQPIEVYVDKPSECRWSKNDKSFREMENTMSCDTNRYQINADLRYVCTGDLTGIQNDANNTFYFRCKSYPRPNNGGNVEMTTSEKLTLQGTKQELVITKSGPNGTIIGETDDWTVTLNVETAFGAENGKATCTFSDKKAEVDRNPMETTGDVIHNQSVYASDGSYAYYFRCVDAGGNSAESNTTFKVEIDRAKPLVARAYKEGDYLKVVTTEAANCTYSTTSCTYDFDEGLTMGYEDAQLKTVHITSWALDKTFYIKCSDISNNKPAPNACSIIAKGSEL